MSLPPIYRAQGQKLLADTCEPLRAAAQSRRVSLAALARGHYPGRKLPANALPGLQSVGYWDARSSQDWGLAWHRNEGIELTFLERGKLEFAVEGHSQLLRADDITVTRPWQSHRVGAPNVDAGRLHWLILDVGVRRPHQVWRWPAWLVMTKRDRTDLTKMLRHNERPVWRANPEIRDCFRRIAAAVERDRKGEQVSLLAALINELFVALLTMLRRQQPKLDDSLASTQRTVDLFWSDLHQNIEHAAETWTVSDLARQCGLGVTQFIHLTKRHANATPMQELNRCRLDAAAQLLKSELQRSVTDIALSCGFASSQYFATLFRRQFGCTPREFRERRR
jgi:AraC family L-rhamnose operon regulatory protein RhaS